MDVNGECCNLQYAPDTENIRTLKVERNATIIYRLHTREGDTLGGQQVVTFSRTCCVNASFRSTNCHSKERIQRKAFKATYSKERNQRKAFKGRHSKERIQRKNQGPESRVCGFEERR